jgi:hypothetical protein
MAMSALYLERICEELDRRKIGGGGVTVFVARGAVSKAVGQKRVNKLKICEKSNEIAIEICIIFCYNMIN